MSMMTENGTTDTRDVSQRLDALEKAQAVQAATESGAQATQAATLSGAQATQAAAHAGTWATMAAGSIALIVGMFLGLTIANTNHDRA
jgi:precorrin-6x reductase